VDHSRIFAEFPGKDNLPLSSLCLHLLEEQKKSWPRLTQAYQALSAVRTRSISSGNYEVKLQFNPARAVSSGAAVDKESIRNRPCFLCSENLPPEQKGVLYQNDYLFLANPAPIFERHFTIVHGQHRPQMIASSLTQLLELTCDLAPDFTVFYNGPACGASAPDHLHFQAIPANILPLELSITDHFRLIKNASVQLYRVDKIDRCVVLLKGSDKDCVQENFNRLIKAAQNVISVSGEPMINVLCFYTDNSWRLLIFFRSKHRPEAFFAAGEQRFFVSPGTIDMAGIIITPLIENFQCLNAAQIRNIYREVSLPEETLNLIIAEMN
jgi:hypothetical protein